MIVSDLLRAGVVLGFLLIDDVGDLPLLYILTALQVAISATFLPARSASIPNITTANELLTANTLMSATWSTMLAIGAALGGFATEWLGIQGVFLVDSASYLVSASFIVMTVIPHQKVEQASGSLIHSAYEDIVDGWRHLVTHPEVGRIAPAKAVWAIGGGALVYMLALLGEEVSPEATAVGIGVLFAARGVGTGIGPVLARAWFTDEEKWPMILGACIVTSGVLYLGVGMLPWTYWVAVCVIIAHAASGANWVLASVLLQKRTEDHFRGRVFGTEWLLLTLADALSILAASLMLESAWIDLRIGFQLFAGIQIVTGILWVVGIVPWEQRENVEVSKRGNVGSSERGNVGTWEGGNAS